MTNLIRSLRALIFALSILIRSRDVYARDQEKNKYFFFVVFLHTFSFAEDPLQPKLFRSIVVHV